ncbi:MAG: HAD family phosphatase [Patescibacteria group bacterium]
MSGEFKVVAFDVDGTLMESNLWPRLHKVMGLNQAVDTEWMRRYLKGDLTLREWYTNIGIAWRTHPESRSVCEEICKDFTLLPNADHLVKTIMGRGIPVALISSGLDLYVEAVAARFGISHVYCYTKTIFNEQDFFHDITFTSLQSEHSAKVDGIRDLEKIYGVSPEEVLFVGDSINDLEAFQYTKRGILYGEGNETLRSAAWKQVNDLKDVLAFVE